MGMTDGDKLEAIESMYLRSKKGFPEVPEVTSEQLQALRGDSSVVIVDVRTPEEQAVSMIEGAITSREFEATPEKFADKTVVAYCTMGYRSGRYARELQRHGQRAFNLRGAILAWTHSNGALVNTEGSTKVVHVHSPHCDLVAEGYKAIW